MAHPPAQREGNRRGRSLGMDEEKTAFAEFIRTKEEIDKDAVLNQKERFADGQVPGLKIVSGLEDFVIEPTEQELA